MQLFDQRSARRLARAGWSGEMIIEQELYIRVVGEWNALVIEKLHKGVYARCVREVLLAQNPETLEQLFLLILKARPHGGIAGSPRRRAQSRGRR
jgi:hypothetical protein